MKTSNSNIPDCILKLKLLFFSLLFKLKDVAKCNAAKQVKAELKVDKINLKETHIY